MEDIPALWNEKMHAYLGLDTIGNYRNGCMQDIHWTDGAFGYFPTYTLGAMYAAQLFHSVRQALPSLGEDIAAGNLQPLFHWLQHNIWRHGSRFDRDADRQRNRRSAQPTLLPSAFGKPLPVISRRGPAAPSSTCKTG